MKKGNGKKKITQLSVYKSVRKAWAVNPVTKIVPNKKKKTRQQQKREFKRQTNEEM